MTWIKSKTFRWLLLIVVILGLAWFWFFKVTRHYVELQSDLVKKNFWGVTFSPKYALELDLDWRQAYLATLDELQVKKIRLPVYWDWIEKEQGVLDLADYDWMISEGEKRDVSFILVLGRRQPRWPECHVPDWTKDLEAEQVDISESELLVKEVSHFQKYSSISSWQVQNEYFVSWFGFCPKSSRELLKQQIALVRSLDERPVLLTDSGEFSLWRDVSELGDIVGSTMYRVAWNPSLGYIYSAWPAWNYSLKSKLNGVSADRSIVAELQAEPWPANFGHVRALSRAEVDDSFSLQQFRTNAEIARRTGFSEAYFWGVEWWYWMKVNGYPEFWQEAKSIMATDD